VSYQVKTRVFEGPLDLLLQLITSHQLEITDLSLTPLVEEYLEHLAALRDLDIEVTSEFLLIAATLIQLKARHLLPGTGEVDLDEELELAEERDRLLSRLLACLTFKDVAAVFSHRMDGNARYVARLAGLDPDITPARPDVRLGVGTAELVLIAERVFSHVAEEPDLDHLDFDLPSVEDAIGDLRSRMSGDAVAEFDALVEHCSRPIEVVAYFLALLELARWGIVHISQESPAAAITVTHDVGDDTGPGQFFESEW